MYPPIVAKRFAEMRKLREVKNGQKQVCCREGFRKTLASDSFVTAVTTTALPQFMLQVFDGVLAPSTSRYLHTASSLGELGDELHTVFLRDSPPKTAIESCLHSILRELNDPSPCVE